MADHPTTFETRHLQGEPVLLLGGSGYLGRVTAARLLTSTDCPLLLPVRAHHQPDDVLAAIAAEEPDLDITVIQQRVQVTGLPDDVGSLARMARDAGVRGLLHAAGSVSYFDAEALQAGNEDLTRGALTLGEELGVDWFAYLSTAFASGYRDGPIPEALHDAPEEDPTDYTRSKRACEHLVASSGLPTLIARPSVVIGDSRTGRYSGRPYGIYQLWRGFERLLADRWQDEAHAIACDERLQIVHQDHVADGLLAGLRSFLPGRILHLVGDPEHLPTVSEAWQLWFDHLVQPRVAHVHADLAAAEGWPMSTRQRLFLEFTATNLAISSRAWDFVTDGLRRLGQAPGRADLASLLRCQDAFVAASPRLRAYRAVTPEPTPRTLERARAHVLR